MSSSNKSETFSEKNEKREGKKRKLEEGLCVVRQKESTEKSPREKKKTSSLESLWNDLTKYHKKKPPKPLFYLNIGTTRVQVNFLTNRQKSNCFTPLYVEDIHHLLLTSVLGNSSQFPLHTAKLENPEMISKTIFVEIEGLSQQDVIQVHSKLKQHCGITPYLLEILSSCIPFATEMSTLHVITDYYSYPKENYFSMFPMDLTYSSVPTIEKGESNLQNNFSKLHLLLSPIQLVMECYPLPQNLYQYSKSKGYCFSKAMYTPVHNNSPMFAVDCEMCKTVSGTQATRIAVVNENLETIYQTLIKPEEDILDYVTNFSGITEKMLKDVTTTLKDVQDDIRQILPSDAILCGQSLNLDLHALKMIHPYCIDTSVLYSQFGIRQNKISLRELARIYLKEHIQIGKNGHNPIEDAIATMKLVQLKLKKPIKYSDSHLSLKNIENNIRTGEVKNNVLAVNNERQKFPKFLYLNSDSKGGFFKVMTDFSKKVCLIGSKKYLNNYYPEIISDNISCVIMADIKKATEAIAANIKNNDLILTHMFSDFDSFPITELAIKINQIYDSLPSKTLFVVVMSGVNTQPEKNFKNNYAMIILKQ